MKTCPGCNRSLKKSQFSVSKSRYDGLQVYCKECANKKRKEYYLAHHEHEREVHYAYKQKIKDRWINFLKNQKCIDCGESRFYVLDMDHVNGDKEFNISKMVSDAVLWEKIEKEIEKCEVRCSNCHRERHYLERNKLS